MGHKAIATFVYISALSLLVSGCASDNAGPFFETVVAPDPQLQQDLNGLESADSFSQECSTSILAQLPDTLPEAFCYPNATLLDVAVPSEGAKAEDVGVTDVVQDYSPNAEIQQSQWTTNQSLEMVQQFYQNVFDEQQWQVTRFPHELAGAGIFQGVKGNTRITIRFVNFSQLSAPPSNRTNDLISVSKVQPLRYTLEYRQSVAFERDATSEVRMWERDSLPTAIGQRLGQKVSPLRAAQVANEEVADEELENIDETVVGTTLASSEEFRSTKILDLDSVPAEISEYVKAGIALGSVAIEDHTTSSERGEGMYGTLTFRPNEPISRREFARWLVQANNRLHESQSSKQIRLANPFVEPVFEDVSQTDPDFRMIQGLAEAGLISSPLSSATDPSNALFRGDAPLTRETLIAWKISLDVRKGLPDATVETIQETWGFQDATNITPRMLRAVAADYQNGDRANLRRAFGYTLLFQPQKSVTRAEAAAALWYFGTEENGISATELLENQSMLDQPEQNNTPER